MSNYQLYSLAIILPLVYYLIRFLYNHSAPSLKNIPGPEAQSFLLGNIPQLISESAEGYQFHSDLGQNYAGVVKLHGICGGKQLYIFDHAAMESVLVKNEPVFDMAEALLAANLLIFGPCLVSTSGARHRRARKMLNPVFSSSRLRGMFPVLCQIAAKTRVSITQSLSASSSGEIDLLPFLASTSLAFIGHVAFGDSFATSRPEALDDMKQILVAAKRMLIPIQALPLILKIVPRFVGRWLIDFLPFPDLHLMRDLVDILDKSTRDILAKTRAAISAGEEQKTHDQDILTLLTGNQTKVQDRLPEDELLGQLNVMIFAGTDTTSTAMSRCLQELAVHHDVQQRLRDEVTEAAVHGDLEYETLSSLPLLDAVCRETLRMYPPAITASRQATEDAILPLSTPITGIDGAIITQVIVPAGTIVHIGIKAANRNPAVWGTDANEWNPDRWLAPLPRTVTDAQIPGVYPKLMSFIGGPRGCIGFKFAELGMKISLSGLIKDFVFALAEKEIVWQLGVAEAPTYGGKQALPMIVSRVQNKEI